MTNDSKTESNVQSQIDSRNGQSGRGRGAPKIMKRPQEPKEETSTLKEEEIKQNNSNTNRGGRGRGGNNRPPKERRPQTAAAAKPDNIALETPQNPR